MPDTGLPPTLVLPDVDVPDMDFAGLRAQYVALKNEIAPRIARVFEHGRFVLGPEIEELESELAIFCGARHAVAISSGTDALIAPLLAENIGPGAAVFVPSFTFTATAEVVLLLGATPVFVDVDPRTFNIDLEDLDAKIEQVRAASALTGRAIIAVDLFGLPADYDALKPHRGGGRHAAYRRCRPEFRRELQRVQGRNPGAGHDHQLLSGKASRLLWRWRCGLHR